MSNIEGRASERLPVDADIAAYVRDLSRVVPGASAFNPFSGRSAGAGIRRHNLELYLSAMRARSPRTLLLGEAPGYRGMRITGVPFTNRMILASDTAAFGLFGEAHGFILPSDAPPVSAEPTATVLWNALTELHVLPLLWSAFPLHPHRQGEPLTNRAPTAAEIILGLPLWQRMRDLFAIETVVAVGAFAERSVALAGESAVRIRHPSHGGKLEFMAGIRGLMQRGLISGTDLIDPP